MNKINFNDFDKYTKKDKIYLIFYSIMFVLDLAMIILNSVVVALGKDEYTSIIFLIIFGIVFFLLLYLMINYLLVDKQVITIDYEKETLTLNKRLIPSVTLNFKDIEEFKIFEKKTFWNVVNLGSLYILTKKKTYRVKYLVSPKYLAITLNIYVTAAKEGNNNVNEKQDFNN